MKLANKLLEYLRNSTEYQYTGWCQNTIISSNQHIEWCTIKIKSISIHIRQDNFGDYYVNIEDTNVPEICDIDNLDRPFLLVHGKLEDSIELINFLKTTPRNL